MPNTFTIIIDTREQLPFTFADFDIRTECGTLKTGDYGIVGLPGVVVERKSGSDLYGCMTGGRDRFQRELERLAQLEFSAVVVEDSEPALLSGSFGRMNPRSMKATITAWQVRHRTHFIFCPSRAWAEKTTFMLLERFHRDTIEGKRPVSVVEAATA